MPDSFWMMVGIVAPVLIVQVFQFLQSARNNKKSSADRDEIKAQVCEVRDRVETIRTTKSEIEQQIAGAERGNVVRGMEIQRQRDTAPAPLEK